MPEVMPRVRGKDLLDLEAHCAAGVGSRAETRGRQVHNPDNEPTLNCSLGASLGSLES